MKSETRTISQLLQHSFEKVPWYGPSVMETLRDISPSMVEKKIGRSHSIIELVLHMTSWRVFVAEHLNGNDTYEVSDEMNFPKPGSWTGAVVALKQSQARLLEAIDRFPEERLDEVVPSRPYKFRVMLHGIVQHDIYHTGQISLLKRMQSV